MTDNDGELNRTASSENLVDADHSNNRLSKHLGQRSNYGFESREPEQKAGQLFQWPTLHRKLCMSVFVT